MGQSRNENKRKISNICARQNELRHKPYLHGLRNLKNNCWVNSFLQALKHVIEDKEVDRKRCSPVTDCILKLCSQLMDWKTPGVISATELTDILRKNDIFQSESEQDPHEILTFVAENFEEIGLFQKLKIQYERECLMCRTTFLQEAEDYGVHDFFLDIVGDDVQEMLTRFLKDYSPHHDVFCGICNNKTEQRKRIARLNKAPAILILHLNRFMQDTKGPVYLKNCRKVKINREVELEMETIIDKYKLCTIQCHLGRSPSTGHYSTVYIADSHSVLYNDHRVKTQDTNTLLQCEQTETSTYILYYKKIGISKEGAQEKNQKHLQSVLSTHCAREESIKKQPCNVDVLQNIPPRARHCICEIPRDNSLSISCHLCKRFYHATCLGIMKNVAEMINIFICLECQDSEKRIPYEEIAEGTMQKDYDWVKNFWHIADKNLCVPAAVVCSIILSVMDIKTLDTETTDFERRILQTYGFSSPPGWINDNVLNAFLNIINENYAQRKVGDVLIVDTFMTSQILTGSSDVKLKINPLLHKTLILPRHSGCHWTLLIIGIRRTGTGLLADVSCYDPMGADITPNIDRLRTVLKKHGIGLAKIKQLEPKYTQKDTSSCGVFVSMRAFYKIIGRTECAKDYSEEKVNQFRLFMASSILKHGCDLKRIQDVMEVRDML